MIVHLVVIQSWTFWILWKRRVKLFLMCLFLKLWHQYFKSVKFVYSISSHRNQNQCFRSHQTWCRHVRLHLSFSECPRSTRLDYHKMRNPKYQCFSAGLWDFWNFISKGISLALLGFEKVKRKPNRLKSIVTQNRPDLCTGHITFSYNHSSFSIIVHW